MPRMATSGSLASEEQYQGSELSSSECNVSTLIQRRDSPRARNCIRARMSSGSRTAVRRRIGFHDAEGDFGFVSELSRSELGAVGEGATVVVVDRAKFRGYLLGRLANDRHAKGVTDSQPENCSRGFVPALRVWPCVSSHKSSIDDRRIAANRGIIGAIDWRKRHGDMWHAPNGPRAGHDRHAGDWNQALCVPVLWISGEMRMSGDLLLINGRIKTMDPANTLWRRWRFETAWW